MSVSREQYYIDNELSINNNFDTNERRRRSILAVFLAGVQFSVAAFMFTVAVAKIIEHGVHAYVCHFTNWSWTLQMLFYFFTLPAPFILLGLLSRDTAFAGVTQAILFVGFFPLHGIVWTVMCAVTVLLGTKSPFLRNIFTIYPPEIVIIGNDLFHSYPVIALLIYAIVYHKLLFYVLNRIIARNAILDNPTRLSTLIFYQAYVGAAVALAIYTTIFDPRVIYSTDLSVIYGVVVVFFTLTVVNLVPVISVLALKGVASRDAYSHVWLVRNTADPSIVPLQSRAPRLEANKLV